MLKISGDVKRESLPFSSFVACSRYGVMPSVGGRVCGVGKDEQGRAV